MNNFFRKMLNVFSRRSGKHHRLQLFKFSVGLATMSVVLVFYCQYLLQSRCDSSGNCSNDEEKVNKKDVVVGVTAEEVVEAKQQGVVGDDIISMKEEPWENTGKDVNEIAKEQPDNPIIKSVEKIEDPSGGVEEVKEVEEEEEESSFFVDNDEEEEKSVKSLSSWLAKMSSTTNEMSKLDPSPISEDAKEFLFPCARDEYTISDGLMGKNDEGDNLNGEGTVEFEEDSLCRSLNVKKATGTFLEGKLEGGAVIEFNDGSFMKGSFKEGVLHGLVRKFRCKYGLCDFFDNEAWGVPKYLWEISWYRNGHRVGFAWEFPIGGGSLAGRVDDHGDLTASDVVYLYPDRRTAVVGRFVKGVLVTGQESRLSGMEMEGEIAVPLTLLPKGPTYVYEQSNKTHMVGSERSLHLRDPYEEQHLEIKSSTVDGAGRGIFLKKDVKRGTVVGFYNGVRMSDIESKIRKADRRSPYRLDNDWAKKDQVINIPEGYRETKQYDATLGHLINHSKSPNARYGMVEHPRFGRIRSVVAGKDLRAGEELFCDYGFIEKYLEGEEMFKTILDVGQALTKSNSDDFHTDMKYTVKYLRKQVDEYKPYLDMFKTVYKMIGNT